MQSINKTRRLYFPARVPNSHTKSTHTNIKSKTTKLCCYNKTREQVQTPKYKKQQRIIITAQTSSPQDRLCLKGLNPFTGHITMKMNHTPNRIRNEKPKRFRLSIWELNSNPRLAVNWLFRGNKRNPSQKKPKIHGDSLQRQGRWRFCLK